MIRAFIYSFQSEWLKRKRSAASWLVILGAFFIPVSITIGRIINFDSLYAVNTSKEAWSKVFGWAWQPMAFFLLPLGVILATSLITQLEFKNNTWKQLHTSPQSLTTIFFAKLLAVITMLFQFFILFNIGIYLAVVIPSIIFRGIPYPEAAIPFMKFFKIDLKFFICCLPIIILQYIVGLQFKNFLIPLGFGLALYVGSMMAMNWKYGYTMPYIYCALNFIKESHGDQPKVNIYIFSVGYFILFTIAGYILYLNKKEKG